MASVLLDRIRGVKLGTKVYVACVVVLPWVAFYPIWTNDRDIIWYALPVSGPPSVIAYVLLSRSTQFLWPNLIAYFVYFAVILLPLGLYLNTRNAPVGRTLVWITVALSAVTHAALAVLSYFLWNAG